jgi:flagellar biosynthesis/type III secretory pathway chaperone
MRHTELLEAEVQEMRKYLALLEKQKQAIKEGNFDAAFAYSENETQILRTIADYRKITPLKGDSEDNEAKIPKLRSVLRALQETVKTLNLQNRELLKTQLSETQAQLDALKNPYRNTRSIYANSGSGATIQIEA